jgi:hypothetical protein
LKLEWEGDEFLIGVDELAQSLVNEMVSLRVLRLRRVRWISSS